MRHLYLFVVAAAALSSCTSHKVAVEPIRVEPIHITIDVNVKIDRELDSFFEDLDSL